MLTIVPASTDRATLGSHATRSTWEAPTAALTSAGPQSPARLLHEDHPLVGAGHLLGAGQSQVAGPQHAHRPVRAADGRAQAREIQPGVHHDRPGAGQHLEGQQQPRALVLALRFLGVERRPGAPPQKAQTRSHVLEQPADGVGGHAVAGGHPVAYSGLVRRRAGGHSQQCRLIADQIYQGGVAVLRSEADGGGCGHDRRSDPALDGPVQDDHAVPPRAAAFGGGTLSASVEAGRPAPCKPERQQPPYSYSSSFKLCNGF